MFILLNGSRLQTVPALPLILCLDHTPQGTAHGILGAVPAAAPGQLENEIAKVLRLSGFPDVEKPVVASQHATKVLAGICWHPETDN